MSGLPVLASAAFFDLRPDRDTRVYYGETLKQLVAEYPGDAVVATNDPAFFDGLRGRVVAVTDLRESASSLWPLLDVGQFAAVVGRHRVGRKLIQSQVPNLSLAWLAKTAFALLCAEEYGEVLWVDAGLVNSVFGGEGRRYRREAFESELEPWLASYRERAKPCFATIPRKPRAARAWRRDFHGANRWEMEGLARSVGARGDEHHVVGGTMYLTRATASTLLEEFPALWQRMLDTRVSGTEENVLSVLRWKHGWDGRDLREWTERMV